MANCGERRRPGGQTSTGAVVMMVGCGPAATGTCGPPFPPGALLSACALLVAGCAGIGRGASGSETTTGVSTLAVAGASAALAVATAVISTRAASLRAASSKPADARGRGFG